MEQQLIVACLRRVASVRPLVAMVIAEALIAADERDLSGLAQLLVPADAELTLRLLNDVLAEAGGCA